MTTTATLALRIDAPMQSWGLRSRFVNRDTAAEPTKSGVVGLLAAASGIDRTDDTRIRELAALRLGVRVDREGLVERDYHVTQDVPNTKGAAPRNVVSHRYYLADALFLVVLEGDPAAIGTLETAVRAPHWPLFFGRKAFVPAAPLIDPADTSGGPGGHRTTGAAPGCLEDRLAAHPWLENRPDQRAQAGRTDGATLLRTVCDTAAGDPRAELRHDHPESFAPGRRRFRSRTVRADQVPLADLGLPRNGS
ncbi:type I-E CRISPR-associated protein Cas5/CasD [Streptomonospora sediminis]